MSHVICPFLYFTFPTKAIINDDDDDQHHHHHAGCVSVTTLVLRISYYELYVLSTLEMSRLIDRLYIVINCRYYVVIKRPPINRIGNFE